MTLESDSYSWRPLSLLLPGMSDIVLIYLQDELDKILLIPEGGTKISKTKGEIEKHHKSENS